MTTATASKVKTCCRCSGKGFVGVPVAHLGIPGLCMSCDGCGKRRWVSSEQATARKVAELQREQAECQKRGEECKQAYASSPIQQRRGAKSTAMIELEKARTGWRRAAAELQQILGGQVVAGFWEAAR